MTDPDALPDEIPAPKALIEAQRLEIATLKLCWWPSCAASNSAGAPNGPGSS